MKRPGTYLVKSLALALLVAAPPMAWSQAPAVQQITLSASGHVEAPQDWLTVRLGLTREGADAGAVQNQLRTAIEAALATARSQTRAQQMEVRSGAFGVSPRYGRDGKINGWQGSAELVLEGRDVPLITTTAGKLSTLTVSSVGFSLSREARRRLESEVQAQAIERFRARAAEVTQAFGFSSYTLGSVSISSTDEGGRPMPRMMAMEARGAMADAPLPVQAGTDTVSVTVSGSIQVR